MPLATDTLANLAEGGEWAFAYRLIRADLLAVEEIFDAEISSDRPDVVDLCRHLGRFRGKMLRPALLLLTARASGGVRPIHRRLAAVIEMFHLATLVHDDVLDQAKTRRKAVTVNEGWGNESAVMLGDWLISHAYHLCSRVDAGEDLAANNWASIEIAAVSHRVCQGELVQLVSRGELAMRPADYLAIIAAKTAALIGLAARLGPHFNGAAPAVEQACLDYGTDLGIAFQIADDVLDLVGDEGEVGKTLRSDLAEGKPTLPLIQFLQSANPADAQRMRQLLDGHPVVQRAGRAVRLVEPIDPGRVAQAREMLVGAGCIESARAEAAAYVASAKSRLAALPPGEARDVLARLADFATARSR